MIAASWLGSSSCARWPRPCSEVSLPFGSLRTASALIRGGTLDIGAERREGNVEIVARATAEKIAFDETIGRALQGELRPDEISSRTAAAHMIGLLAEEHGGGLQYALSEGALVLGAVIPEPEGMIG